MTFYKRGFTMIEIIATILIIGILAALSAPRFINMGESVKKKAVYGGIAELNARENVLWQKLHLLGEVENDVAVDTAVYNEMQQGYLELGDDWEFAEGSGAPGELRTARLTFKGTELAIARSPAAVDYPGRWRLGSGGGVLYDGSFTLGDFDYISTKNKTTIRDDGVLEMKNGSAVLIAGSDTTDFTATMTAKIISNFNNGNGWAFYYRGEPSKNQANHFVKGYSFQFDPPNTFVVKDTKTDRVVNTVSGSAEVKMSDYFSLNDSFKQGEHTVTVSAEGNQHTIAVDGVEVLSFQDNTYVGEGQVGFRTWGKSTTEFSDLNLTKK
mgnify:CR=1 FL=1